ncbi:MAG: HEAT repeat domain-containing protein [Lentisphaerae bacterium]|nr:HEAT repeat domain-containing protein [Lentisphaerota bacterium]
MVLQFIRGAALASRLAALAGVVALAVILPLTAGCGRQTAPDDAAGTAPGRPADPPGRRPAGRPAPPRDLEARLLAMQPEAPDTAGRAFVRNLSPAQAEALQAAPERLRQAAAVNDWLEVLEELAEIPHPQTLPAVSAALEHDDASVRQKAFAVIEGYQTADILPLVRKGLGDADAEVRLAAVYALAAVVDPAVSALLIEAMQDDSLFVRQAVFAMLEAKPAEVRQDVYEAGIGSPHDDVWGEVVSAILFHPSHDAVMTLMTGLKSPSEFQRDQVNDALQFLVSERFDSYDEARTWWDANRHRFADDLEEKPEDDEGAAEPTAP